MEEQELRSLVQLTRALAAALGEAGEVQGELMARVHQQLALKKKEAREARAGEARAQDIVKQTFALLRDQGDEQLKTSLADHLRKTVRPVAGYMVVGGEEEGEEAMRLASSLQHYERRLRTALSLPADLEAQLSAIESRLRAAPLRPNPSRGSTPTPPAAFTPSSAPAASSASTSSVVSPLKPLLSSIGSATPLPSSLLGRDPKALRSPRGGGGGGGDTETEQLSSDVSWTEVTPRAEMISPRSGIGGADYDSDLDGASSDQHDLSASRLILSQMTPVNAEKRARLAKVGEGQKELVPSKKPPVAAAAAATPSSAQVPPLSPASSGSTGGGSVVPSVERGRTGLGDLLASLWRRNDSDDEEEVSIEIGSPVDVEHVGHLGPKASAEEVRKLAQAELDKQQKSPRNHAKQPQQQEETPSADTVADSNKKAGSAGEKAVASPSTSTPKTPKEPTTMKLPFARPASTSGGKKAFTSKRLLKGGKEEDENGDGDDGEEGIVISGPMDVHHEAHASTAEEVIDEIDSALLKQREVDVEDVFVEELKFAEEWNPEESNL